MAAQGWIPSLLAKATLRRLTREDKEVLAGQDQPGSPAAGDAGPLHEVLVSPGWLEVPAPYCLEDDTTGCSTVSTGRQP